MKFDSVTGVVTCLVFSLCLSGCNGRDIAQFTAEIVGGEESKQLNAKILPRYLTKAALEDPSIGPVMAAGDDITIVITPTTWRGWDMKSLDEQFFGGKLSQSPEKWFLPLDG